MEIKKIKNDKLKYIELLLEADPDEEMIKKYLETGDLYVIDEKDETVCVCIVTQYDKETCELKNIATLPKARGNGYAGIMIKHIFDVYKKMYKKIIVGTTENMIPFYVLNGFTKYYCTIKNFFIDNYEKEIWDGNMQCIDMYYYFKELSK